MNKPKKKKLKLERWHAWAAVAAIGLGSVIAFKKCDAPSTDAPLVIAPAPEPADLLCDLYIASPNHSWGKLQRGVGGAAGILPANLPGVVIALTDLDAQLAAELDGTMPMYGAVAGDPSDPNYVFAMKLVDPRRARVLLIGDAGVGNARFTAREDAGAGMTLLVPNRPYGSAPPKLDVAISPNGYLVIAKAGTDLSKLAPYVTRTLTARPLPNDAAVAVEIPRGALQTTLKPKLDSLWKDARSFLLGQDQKMRAEHGGRAPDFGDPVAITGILDSMLGRRLAIVGDLERVRLVFDITEDAVSITTTLTPDKQKADNAASKWIGGMKSGDAAPVLTMPSNAALAISMRDDATVRAEQGKDLDNAIVTSLGSRLMEPEKNKVHEITDEMTKAREESWSAALLFDDPPGIVLRAPTNAPEPAKKALHAALDLAKAEPFKDLLRVRDVTWASEDVPKIGNVSVGTVHQQAKPKSDHDAPPVRVRDAGAGAPLTPQKEKGVGVAYAVDQGVLLAGIGPEPLVTLRLGAVPDRRLSDEGALKRFTDAIGADASTIIVAQPLRLDAKRANLPIAPIGIAVGKKGTNAFVRIDVSDGLLREAARWQMGF